MGRALFGTAVRKAALEAERLEDPVLKKRKTLL